MCWGILSVGVFYQNGPFVRMFLEKRRLGWNFQCMKLHTYISHTLIKLLQIHATFLHIFNGKVWNVREGLTPTSFYCSDFWINVSHCWMSQSFKLIGTVLKSLFRLQRNCLSLSLSLSPKKVFFFGSVSQGESNFRLPWFSMIFIVSVSGNQLMLLEFSVWISASK